MSLFGTTCEAKKQKLDEEIKQDFSVPWHFSDVVLVVEERKFHVHRSTLSIWSPVFETMFTSEFKEKTAQEIPLLGKKASEIDALLKLIYSRDEQVTEKTFEFLLKLADEYQMKKVKTLCICYMRSVLRRETALHLYALACKYKFETFKKECLEETAQLQLDYIKNHDHFLELDIKDRYDMISQKLQAVESAFLHNICTKGSAVGFAFGSVACVATQAIGGATVSNFCESKLTGKFHSKHTLQSCLKCQNDIKKQSSFYQ